MSANVKIELYEILYSDATWAAREPDLLPLDNRANPCPEWREYDPIRRFFTDKTVAGSNLLRIFSSKFHQKNRAHRGGGEVHTLDALKLAERAHRNGLCRQLFIQRRDQLHEALTPLRARALGNLANHVQ